MSGGELGFDLPGAGRVLFTDRSHGNLSSVGGVGAQLGEAARESLRGRIGVGALARGYQVHGTRVRRLIEIDPVAAAVARPHADEADGQATSLEAVGTMVLTADCLPVAVGSRGAVAMLHAGWRGLAGGILEEGIAAVRDLGREDRLVAVVGPGAGVCCYEVGEDVHEEFGGAHRHGTHIDLRAIAGERLLASGVAEVLHAPACTICDERFFSHRREGRLAGRQAGVAWLS
ncbi:MAG TPA: polyphenol oxidase family protein [Solirubrobacteraceae bacterium]|nr:polyphenol oxidase family protein [Solirubrobacteraceae bacterium]